MSTDFLTWGKALANMVIQYNTCNISIW
jgi:hypothetical protein